MTTARCIGILGSGQLGRMLAIAAAQLGLDHVLALGLERAGPLVKPVALHQLQHAAV